MEEWAGGRQWGENGGREKLNRWKCIKLIMTYTSYDSTVSKVFIIGYFGKKRGRRGGAARRIGQYYMKPKLINRKKNISMSIGKNRTQKVGEAYFLSTFPCEHCFVLHQVSSP